LLSIVLIELDSKILALLFFIANLNTFLAILYAYYRFYSSLTLFE